MKDVLVVFITTFSKHLGINELWNPNFCFASSIHMYYILS